MSLILTSCAHVGTAFSVAGGSASMVNAYWGWLDRDNLIVLSKECLWYRQIKLTEHTKKGMDRVDKEWKALMDLMYEKDCLGKDK